MIWPEFFPESRASEHAERKVFNELSRLADRYDIFYSTQFVTNGLGKRPEFEVDFIIAEPQKAVLCVEVKGGVVRYRGGERAWYQNNQKLRKNPVEQASGASHGLQKSFGDMIAGMPIDWVLCFPDCQLPSNPTWPTSLIKEKVIDQSDLSFLVDALDSVFGSMKRLHADRKGISRINYESFRRKLLRDMGLIQVLGTKLQLDDRQFAQLEKSQVEMFQSVASNPDLLVNGPAGSGKTLLAKVVAEDWAGADMRVLLLCYNRTLANDIKRQLPRGRGSIDVDTFHGFAKKVIDELHPGWWVRTPKNEDFWHITVPFKLHECLEFQKNMEGGKKTYDGIIIDEGQDFREYWFEVLLDLVKKGGRRLIFMDEMQNIFGHFTKLPASLSFTRYHLIRNCRNSKAIVHQLSKVAGQDIQPHDGSPQGEAVEFRHFVSRQEQLDFLNCEMIKLIRKRILPENMLIMVETSIQSSCLAGVSEVGGVPLRKLEEDGVFREGKVHWSTIKRFKGLERDVIFILDINRATEDGPKKKYTSISRARHLVYLLDR